MSKGKKNILLFLIIIMISIIIVFLRNTNKDHLNYYKLNSNYYLHKYDYFSSYSIATYNASEYQDIIYNVKKLAIYEDLIIVQFKEGEEYKFMVLENSPLNFYQIDKVDLPSVSANGINFKKPWVVVEHATLNNQGKLLIQILTISLIIMIIYLLIRTLNLTPMTKGMIKF